MSNPITNEQVAICYKYAKKVYYKDLTVSEATVKVTSSSGMKDVSANMYLHAFLKMMLGEYYSRTINAYATDYYLKNICTDFGVKTLLIAISSVKKHLEYYESLGKSKQNKIKQIIKKYLDNIDTTTSLQDIESSLSEQVIKSINETKEDRKRRLKFADKTPRTVNVSTKVYIRNPDVVAEVLIRANGICERCNKEAPFNRAKDGTPYLEVHHIVQLSKGGEDSEKNAKALCPNCHRNLHFGIDKNT